MAIFVPSAGTLINDPSTHYLAKTMSELCISTTERFEYKFGVAGASFVTAGSNKTKPAISDFTDGEISSICKDNIDILRSKIEDLLDTSYDAGVYPECGPFVVSGTSTPITTLSQLFTLAGYSSWDTDYIVSNKDIWVQFKDMLEELTEIFLEFDDLESSDNGNRYGVTITGVPNQETAWDNARGGTPNTLASSNGAGWAQQHISIKSTNINNYRENPIDLTLCSEAVNDDVIKLSHSYETVNESDTSVTFDDDFGVSHVVPVSTALSTDTDVSTGSTARTRFANSNLVWGNSEMFKVTTITTPPSNTPFNDWSSDPFSERVRMRSFYIEITIDLTRNYLTYG
jgi:hypothetical protein